MESSQLTHGQQLTSFSKLHPGSCAWRPPARLWLILLLLLLSLTGSVSAAEQHQPAHDGALAAGTPAILSQVGPNQLLPPIDENMCPGEIYPFELTIYLPRTPAKGDIVFAFDTTGSMAPVIYSAQENAIRIMDDLNRLISDVQFGVMDIEDYPLEPYGANDNQAYRLHQSLTTDRNAVRFAIDTLEANSGSDQPEAYTRAVYEAHADSRLGWRENARHLLLIFGDSFPHDNDLNEGMAHPPHRNKGPRWETGHPPSLLDLGRDGVPGTSDDLDFQTELATLVERDITLLSVVTPAFGYPAPTQMELVTYWNFWAAPSGGKSVPLWNAGDLPELIRNIVEDTIVGVIKRLTLETEPEFFTSWVVFDPAEINDIEIPMSGALSFLGRVEAPPDALAGTYDFRIIAVGDGIVYGEKQVRITVPEQCFPDRDYPNWFYLPLIMKAHAENESGGSGRRLQ
ncbi:MAG: vWA domain-containing protein [Anaerolineae bacterium]